MKLLIILLMSSLSVLSVNAFSCDVRGGGACAYFIGLPGLAAGSWVSGTSSPRTLDYSGWHRCPASQTGGVCGSRSLTTGDSSCITHSQQVGFDFELKGLPTGVKFKTGYSTAWSVCNNRAETITCSPSRGYQGRAEIILELQGGVARYNREPLRAYPAVNRTCPLGGRYNAVAGRGRPANSCIGATKSGAVIGYWPRNRYSQCVYRRI